ncbi:hypothetical protein DPMN_099263 [Dreissena polymorpha]|uniref:Uncharacterized protein n=1 Tax=Dreissena polymorpha TaxID=45954 RepID=A0A9D4LEL4_DREPO|nr:hypothetical protein DPMN_099263 [Dreissena polymorpha]
MCTVQYFKPRGKPSVFEFSQSEKVVKHTTHSTYQIVCKPRLYNLNASDSGLHHTVSLMYVGGRHIGFGTT